MIVLVFKKKIPFAYKKMSNCSHRQVRWSMQSREVTVQYCLNDKKKRKSRCLITLSVVTFLFLVFRESKVNNDECHPIKPADSLKTATKQQLSGCEASRNTKSCKFNTGFLFFSAFIDSFTFCSSLSTQLRLINTHSCHFELLIRTLHNVKLKAFIVD